jgi:hypothetical protein
MGATLRPRCFVCRQRYRPGARKASDQVGNLVGGAVPVRERLTTTAGRGNLPGGARAEGDDGMAEASNGYSTTPLPGRLGIHEGSRVALVAAPSGFERVLGELPCGARLRTSARGRLDVVVFFVTRHAELSRRFPTFARALEADGGLWIAWPKQTSGVATDLGFDRVQRVGLDAGLVDNKVCAIDATWSGLRFVRRLVDRSA